MMDGEATTLTIIISPRHRILTREREREKTGALYQTPPMSHSEQLAVPFCYFFSTEQTGIASALFINAELNRRLIDQPESLLDCCFTAQN